MPPFLRCLGENMYQSDVYFKLNERQQVYSLPSLISAWNVKSDFAHIYDNTQSLDRHLRTNMFCLIKVIEGSGCLEVNDQCFFLKKNQLLQKGYGEGLFSIQHPILRGIFPSSHLRLKELLRGKSLPKVYQGGPAIRWAPMLC